MAPVLLRDAALPVMPNYPGVILLTDSMCGDGYNCVDLAHRVARSFAISGVL
jgi:hypothetical protein